MPRDDDLRTGPGHEPATGTGTRHRGSDRPAAAPEGRPAKTGVAAAFALAVGVTALFFVLTVVLSPVGLVVGLLGVVLGVLGIRAARHPGITGRGVAITGLVLSVIAVLLAGLAAIGVTTFLNNESAVDRLEQQVEQLREQMPGDVEIPTPE